MVDAQLTNMAKVILYVKRSLWFSRRFSTMECFWWVSSSNLTKCMSESWECLEPWARTIQNWQTGAAMYLLSTVNSYSYNLVHMWGEIVCWWNGCSHEQYIYICNYIYTHTLHVCEICMYTVYIYTYIRWYLIILPDNSDIRSIIYVILAVLAHV